MDIENAQPDVSQGDAVRDDDGVAAPTPIDWDNINPRDIPETLIKSHPAYRKVVEESIKRRIQLKDLKRREMVDSSEINTPPSEGTGAPSDSDDDEMPAWARMLVEKINSLEGYVAASQQTTIEAAKAAAVRDFNLPPAAVTFLQGGTPDEIKENAARLAAAFNIPRTGAGNPAGGVRSPVDELAARALSKLKTSVNPLERPGIFDPEVQARLRGPDFNI